MEVCNSGFSATEKHVDNKKDEQMKSALLGQEAGSQEYSQHTSTSQIPAEEIERLRKMCEDLCREVDELAEPRPLNPEVVKRYFNEKNRQRRRQFWKNLFRCCCCHSEGSAL